MQRGFLISILQELAGSQPDSAPQLIIGFEEPELYQHPPQAQHMAHLLAQLGNEAANRTSVIVTTHSPYFVTGKGFESVRMVRKDGYRGATHVTMGTYAQIEEKLSEALQTGPKMPSSLMAAIEQILQPSQRELFFASTPVLVEGLEDVALISTHMHLTGKWKEFRRLGCHFIIAQGKTNMSRPLAIANTLGLPTFVVFDADTDRNAPDAKKQNRRDNLCILRLCYRGDIDPLPSGVVWAASLVMWHTNIADVVRDDFGAAVWNQAQERAREKQGLSDGVRAKNSLLLAATLEELAAESKHSESLTDLTARILAFAAPSQPAGDTQGIP